MNRFSAAISCAALLLALSAGIAGASVRVDEEEIVFNLSAPGADRVYVVGDFNGWNPTIDRLIEVEGRFEIRLYLLPGRYRYRFVVDGASIPDPDNPVLDPDGNSVFHLVETSAGLVIATSGEGELAEGPSEELSVAAELSAVTGAWRDALHAVARMEGRSGDRIEARLAVGCEADIHDDEIRSGEVLFARAAGIYHFEKGELRAFTRDADLDLRDPASLFGHVGIYRYPLGSLCRGFRYGGRLPLGVEGTAFYASRLEDPEGGFEPVDAPVAHTLIEAREIADSDIMGLRMDGRIWKARLSYLMRRDRRPFPDAWAVSDPPDVYFTGYERVLVDGFVLSLEGDGPVTFEAELLEGESRLSSLESHAPAAWGEPYEAEYAWQEGRRFYSGIRFEGERGGFALSIDQTILDGDPADGGGRGRSERAVMQCGGDVRFPFGDIGVRGAVERYGSGAGLFWSRRRNFFLDGDDITIGRLPFIESSNLYEVEIRFSQPVSAAAEEEGVDTGREDHYELFALPLRASFIERGDGAGERVRELRFSNGADLHDLVRLFVDTRYISYHVDGWEGERDFLDIFVALRAMVRQGSWISLGVGVNPSVFDGWLYRRTGYGREGYLVERGLLDSYPAREDLLGALEEGERELSEEWSITFEAFVRFW